jgi:hypothetical protein
VGWANRDKPIRPGMGFKWSRVQAIRPRVSLDLVPREISHFLSNNLLGVALLTILI